MIGLDEIKDGATYTDGKTYRSVWHTRNGLVHFWESPDRRSPNQAYPADTPENFAAWAQREVTREELRDRYEASQLRIVSQFKYLLDNYPALATQIEDIATELEAQYEPMTAR